MGASRIYTVRRGGRACVTLTWVRRESGSEFGRSLWSAGQEKCRIDQFEFHEQEAICARQEIYSCKWKRMRARNPQSISREPYFLGGRTVIEFIRIRSIARVERNSPHRMRKGSSDKHK